jgi:hypothetical protein
MAKAQEDDVEKMEKGLLEGMIEAMADKHSQLDIRLNSLTLRLPGTRTGLVLNGTISLSVHMRDLTDQEKQALANHHVSMLKA